MSAFDEFKALSSEPKASERNRRAVLLAEAKTPGLMPVLIELIKRPELKDERGTLITCLQHYDYAEHFELLVSLVLTGNWEVAHEIYDLLTSINEVSGNAVSSSLDLLTKTRPLIIDEEWRVGLIDELLTMFE